MISRSRLALLRSLHRREARAEQGLYLAEGRRLVMEALLSGAPVEEILVTEAFSATGEGAALVGRAGGAAVTRIAERDLRRVADTRTPQGVLAVLARREGDRAALEGDGVFLALDGVADPGNVGTLVRSADAFGARAVLAGPGSADFENGKVLRAAMGSTFHLPLLTVADLPDALARMRAGGATVLATVLDGEDLYEVPGGSPRVCVVMGNEVRGVSPEVRATTDREITVPCPGRAESLNVAMAGAIVLSRLARVTG
ncbi:MAG: TrmH family RNA methyltransferase, partial [Planctomycetota bacterium]